MAPSCLHRFKSKIKRFQLGGGQALVRESMLICSSACGCNTVFETAEEPHREQKAGSRAHTLALGLASSSGELVNATAP